MAAILSSLSTNDAIPQMVRSHLALVFHAHRCLQQGQQTTSPNICTVPHCSTMRNTLQHMIKCPDSKSCSFPYCTESRCAIRHWKSCETSQCLICSSSPHHSKKAWLQQGHRDQTIEKIISFLLNLTQVNRQSLSTEQFASLEKLTTNIEKIAFNVATSPENYIQCIIKYIHRIRTASKENPQISTTTTSASADVQSEDLAARTETPKVETTASASLMQRPAVFSIDGICGKMIPIFRCLFDQEDGNWFRQPVTEAIAPGYFNIIKYPMDFSTIRKKFNDKQYTTPFQFWEDMWLVFDNTWKYNKKTHPVYEAATQLGKIFTEKVDPIMKNYGYCCGHRYAFLPLTMSCHGRICSGIPRDGVYFVYDNPDGDKYTFCKKCFDSVKSKCISVGDDPAQPSVKLPKMQFRQAKNDHQEQEAMVDCIVCSRRFHTICVLYHEHIWPQGYVCDRCVHDCTIKREKNDYSAHKLQTNELSSRLEQRVNDFLRNECGSDTGRVTIRVLAASDRICEVKPRFKKHFGAQVSDGYPYRTKAIFAFQEIDGVDVVLFGMYVQEYDGGCPGPNSKRVYISYLDSIHYFRPENQRTSFYHQILIGYLEHVKQLGFVYAHIWACPPKKGDDYIFHCHPLEQRVPTPDRLQEWYKTMLDLAVQQHVIVDYHDIKEYADRDVKEATDIPYFEDDHWPKMMEDLLEQSQTTKSCDNDDLDHSFEPEQATEGCNKRKLCDDSSLQKRKNSKSNANQRRIVRKRKTDEGDLISQVRALIEKERKSFFIARLHRPTSTPATVTDPDPLIQCDLMESRDAFLSFAYDKHCEFSTLRRAKYSTMVLLIELHSSTMV